ncbi:Hypothetical protein BCAN_A0101 [Brucella canis ATCC 23365]|uniref:Uncharacterized protein n=1 Tax=Brucella canis (strain ATCC 23365 / NCTC 10854 / RM-666) TaxID=483179 RepID=A9M6V1_BRUC2|nr:Hypothetical protein BCAN_A0101 [Brucella canis ATCC 23365]
MVVQLSGAVQWAGLLLFLIIDQSGSFRTAPLAALVAIAA